LLIGSVAVSTILGAQPARAFPPDQVARGEAVWNRVCAECHGPDSTDPDAPLLLRPDSLRRFPNAAAAHKYISESMPNSEPGALPAEEYWDVLAFLLAHNGVGEGDAALGPDTAGGIPTRAQGGSQGPATGAPPPAGSPAAPDGSAEPPAGEEGEEGAAPAGP
jgi:hypothetical protein